LIPVWYKPEEEEYLEIMREVLERRALTQKMNFLGDNKEEMINCLALASFGLPRSFLTMTAQLIEGADSQKKLINRLRSVINDNCSIINGVFESISTKLPRYAHFVAVGNELESAMVERLKKYNRQKTIESKSVIIGIAEPIEVELQKILDLLEYVGIVRPIDPISQGSSGGKPSRYQRYVMHYSILISKNALHLGTNYNLSVLISALKKYGPHATTYDRGSGLLGKDFQSRCTLNLEPCRKCGAPRISENAKFCVQCGERLSDVSIYKELLKTDIEELPLPKKKIQDLKKASIQLVQDILLDEENKNIRNIKGIGATWAHRIRNAAEEFVSV